MTILATVRASAPASEVIIPTIEIAVPGKTPIRVCMGFEDQMLGVDGNYYLFEASSITVALPKKDTSGRQSLRFGIANVSGRDQEYVDAALESGQMIPLIYREYLASDKSAPARAPRVMVLTGGTMRGGESVFDAAYYDLLNAAWPRERYTAENAPGLKYI